MNPEGSPPMDPTRASVPTPEHCHDLLMNAPVGVFISTPEGRLLYANRLLATLYGHDTPQAMLRSVTDIGEQLYADFKDRTEFRRLLRANGRVANHECRMIRRDGSVFWASLNASVMREKEGGAVLFQGYILDITDRRQAEERSRLSEEKFAQVFMAAPNAIAIIRLDDGIIVDVNAAFEETTGWKRSEVMGQAMAARGFGVDRQELQTMLNELKKGRDVFSREFRFRSRNRAERDGVYSARPILIDEVPHFIFILQDVTQKKQAEEAMVLTQFAMDQAPESILWVDDQGNLIYANRAACSSMGFKQDELLRMKVFDVDPDFHASGWEQHKIDLKRLGRMTFEGRHRTKEGRLFPVEVTTNYIEYKGRFLGIAFDRDITERKKAEEERDKLQLSLFQAQKMESLGILAGGVAHDFNNLLQIMGGNIEVLLAKSQPDDPDGSRLATVSRSIERAGRLVQQLLLFGRKALVQRKPLDLNREVDEAVKILERTIPKMILIKRHLAGNLWPVSVDPVHVEQVLLNLGTNAVDAMPHGGKLVVETKNILLDVGLTTGMGMEAAPGPYVLLTVTDTGCGMTKKTLAHVFDPFFTTKEVGKGTGLGLSSTYGIVKSHGGHIQCYSEPGQGTTFKIYWPALGQEGFLPESPLALDMPRGGNETILVVDDEPEIRDLTREILVSFGYRVLLAENGEQALEIYDRNKGEIDLILLDLNMPGMGGTKSLQELLSRDPSVRVLISSGYTQNGHAQEALLSGAMGFIGKPYQIKDLAARVRTVLDE